jgi:hypothetical protein
VRGGHTDASTTAASGPGFLVGERARRFHAPWNLLTTQKEKEGVAIEHEINQTIA